MEDFKSTILSENNSGMPRLIIANTIKVKAFLLWKTILTGILDYRVGKN